MIADGNPDYCARKMCLGRPEVTYRYPDKDMVRNISHEVKICIDCANEVYRFMNTSPQSFAKFMVEKYEVELDEEDEIC